MTQTKWPSSQYWALLAERFEVKYNNNSIKYLPATDIELNNSHGTDTEYISVKQSVQDNFIKVLCHFNLFYFFPTFKISFSFIRSLTS